MGGERRWFWRRGRSESEDVEVFINRRRCQRLVTDDGGSAPKMHTRGSGRGRGGVKGKWSEGGYG